MSKNVPPPLNQTSMIRAKVRSILTLLTDILSLNSRKMKPKKMSLKNFNLVESLQTMSCFAVAACVWSHSEIKQKINKCLIPGSVYFRDDSYIPEMMHYLIRSVEALLVKLHPTLPPSIRAAVQESIRFIGT